MKKKTQKFVELFRQIDEPLQNHFYMLYVYDVVLLIAGICASIALKSINSALLSLVAFLIIFFINTYRVTKCLEGEVFKIEGICEETDGNFYKKHSFSSFLYKSKNPVRLKRDYVLIKTADEKYVKIYTSKHYVLRPGNQIVAYIPKDGLFIENKDSYMANILYFLYVERNKA